MFRSASNTRVMNNLFARSGHFVKNYQTEAEQGQKPTTPKPPELARQHLCDILGDGIAPEQIYQLLDMDGDGSVKFEEFCHQLMKSDSLQEGRCARLDKR